MNKHSMLIGPGEGRGAFSLVEVVLALGITTFAILTLVGLLSVAVESNKDSRADSVAVFIGDNIRSRVQSDPYWPWTEATISSVSFPQTTNYWFSFEGLEVPSTQAYYRAAVTFTNSPSYPSKRFDLVLVEVVPLSRTNQPGAGVVFTFGRAHQMERLN